MPAKQRRTLKAKVHDTLDDKLDRALEDSFPASDPVSFIEPGPAAPGDKIRTGRGRPAKRKATRS